MNQPPARVLSDQNLREIFERDVLPTLDAPSRDNPRLLIFGGPQGSRKTTLRPVAAEQLGMREAVWLDGDDLYKFHPRFDGLALEHGGLAAMGMLQADINELRTMTLDHVQGARKDLMLVGPYTQVELTLGQAARFAGSGYQVEMAYTAPHPARSQLGVMHRHHQAMQPGGADYSALASVELQEKIIAGVPAVMAAAQERGAVAALHVVDVDAPGVAFSTRRGPDGQWVPATPVTEVVESTRARPWSGDVRADFARRREAVAGRRSLARAAGSR